jgi:histidine triad (HIT) family protein
MGEASGQSGEQPIANHRAPPHVPSSPLSTAHSPPPTTPSPRPFYPAPMTIFAKIIAGQIPCHRVYEDAHVLAFLDINPLSRGHTLVIPKEPAPTLDMLSDDSAAAIGRVLPKIGRAVMAATGATAFNVLQNNGAMAHQVVMHVHFHVIPKFPDGTGLGIGWNAGSLTAADGAALAQSVADRLR